VSLRSNKNRNIDTTKISTKYGGGGHKNASGFTIDDIWKLITAR
jgi:nanoRNase/pAp phosphatase (c-di-AMP/oligoRNAs hydrolase)